MRDLIPVSEIGNFNGKRLAIATSLGMLTAPAPASTVTWELGFVHLNRDTCSKNDWWGFRCTADSAEKGYVHERAAIWDPEGRLAAYSRQTTTIFA